MLKASAGGGGKGMRLCEDEARFKAAYDGARREAGAAFGDETVYLEKAIVRPRHVEVQVFALQNHGAGARPRVHRDPGVLTLDLHHLPLHREFERGVA
jgi:acetyl/propionyl-CoA carboxylase alpha subunit